MCHNMTILCSGCGCGLGSKVVPSIEKLVKKTPTHQPLNQALIHDPSLSLLRRLGAIMVVDDVVMVAVVVQALR